MAHLLVGLTILLLTFGTATSIGMAKALQGWASYAYEMPAQLSEQPPALTVARRL